MQAEVEMGAVEGDIDLGGLGCRRPLDRARLDELGDPGRGLPDGIVEPAVDRRWRAGTRRRHAGAAREDTGRGGGRRRGRGAASGGTPATDTRTSARAAGFSRVGQHDPTGGARSRPLPAVPGAAGERVATAGFTARAAGREVPVARAAAGGIRRQQRHPGPRQQAGNNSILQREDLVEDPVRRQAAGYQTGPRVDQPGGDAQHLAQPLVPTGHDPPGTQVAPQPRGGRRVRRRRNAVAQCRRDHCPSKDHHIAERLEVGTDRLGDSIADPVVGSVLRDVRERHHRDRARRRQGGRVGLSLAGSTGWHRLRGQCGGERRRELPHGRRGRRRQCQQQQTGQRNKPADSHAISVGWLRTA